MIILILSILIVFLCSHIFYLYAVQEIDKSTMYEFKKLLTDIVANSETNSGN